MQVSRDHKLWSHNNRYLISLLASCIILFFIIVIPIRQYSWTHAKYTTINVSFKNINNPETNNTSDDVQKPSEEKNIEQPKESNKTPTISQKNNIKKPKIEKKEINTTTESNVENSVKKIPSPPPEPKLPSSGVILESLYGPNRTLRVDKEFQALTHNPYDFKFKHIAPPEWRRIQKLINEEIDKPRVQMYFYPEGIAGATERFFDKITFRKKFTTRFGTKIECAMVGLIVLCGWK